MKSYKIIMVAVFLFSIQNSFAQVGIGTTTPNASSILDVTSTEGGMLIPRMTQTDRDNITSPATGLLIYQTNNTPGFYFYNSSNWIAIGAGNKNTLDQAYDEGGAGAGRTITADNGAVVINGNDGLQNTGTYGSGAFLDLSGPGTRMFFYPRKAAFRAGTVDGNQWNEGFIGIYSTAMGFNTRATGSRSTAMGFSTLASNVSSTAIGTSTIASGTYSTAMGNDTEASGNYSTAMGNNTEASGAISTAMGSNTIASGGGSTAIGVDTEASGIYSTAMGYNTVASGSRSTAMGRDTEAIGDYSTAMGRDTEASMSYSTAMGYNTMASGINSTAMGRDTEASGEYATVMGHGTEAPSYSETSIGHFNNLYTPNSDIAPDNADKIFSIGNGDNSFFRSNALTIYKNGLMNINDEYDMPLTDGTVNQVMATNGTGQVNFVDASSVVTTTKSVFKALLTSSVTIPASSSVKLTYNSESFDLLNEYDDVNGTFTAANSGYYRINAAYYRTASANFLGIAIYINGTSSISFSAQSDYVNIDNIIYLNALDVVEIYAFNNASGGVTVSATATGRNYFEVHQID